MDPWGLCDLNKQKKGTPKNNKAQNKQFKNATKGLTKEQKRMVHDMITGENYSYQEIRQLVRDLFSNKIMVIPLPNDVIDDFMPLNESNIQERIDKGIYDL